MRPREKGTPTPLGAGDSHAAPAVRAVLAHPRPGSTDAMRLLLQVDIVQGVDAVLAVLAREEAAQRVGDSCGPEWLPPIAAS